MPNSIDTALLARYFDRTATPEEQASVQAWIGDDPARSVALAEWHAAWHADVERLGASYDAEAAWARMSERIGLLTLVRAERPTRGVPLGQLGRPTPRYPTIIRWAAAAVVVLLAGAGVWRAVGSSGPSRVSAPLAARKYTTPRGQRGIVRLPDGTEVMLNVASRLTIPATFGAAGQPRALGLEGEAYFTVVHDATRPFHVHTRHGATRDIGTRFDIRAYPDDVEERISVTEGEVAVRADSAAIETPLRKGQVAMITASGQVSVVQDVDADQALAWTRGRLQLDDVTLTEAARWIGRWYDLDVRVTGDELAQRRVVGSYSNEPAAQVLGIIAAAVGARYELQGRSVTFFSRDGR